MKVPEEYENEGERLRSLNSYSVMDSLPETDYDNLTRLAAQICGTPISLITLLDDRRQWFKSNHGLEVRETPKEHAFCAHAINGRENLFMVEDARKDRRFQDNPLVTSDPHVIFYAGVPLKTGSGMPLGTLCVIDHEPKILSEGQIDALTILSTQVMRLLELRKSKSELESAHNELGQRNKELERFADAAAHDLKSPLGNIMALTDVLKTGYSEVLDGRAIKILEMIGLSSDSLGKLIDGLLEHAKSLGGDMGGNEKIVLQEIWNAYMRLFSARSGVKMSLVSQLEYIYGNRTLIDRVLINLIANAIKYNDKKIPEIKLEVKEIGLFYQFSVTDNGPGIPERNREKIFELFETLTNKDRFGKRGSGIGLATARRTVEYLGGTIHVENNNRIGSKFIFSVTK